MKLLQFELYFFAFSSVIAFSAFELDAVTITASTNANFNNVKHAEKESKENREHQFQDKSMMNSDDSESDSDLTYDTEVFDGNARLLPSFYTKRSSRINVFARSCIRRNGACDNRPYDCCFSSSCRCNLWGTNCRCQRVGLFQKWG